VPYVAPPNHLEITSHARVGVVVYDDSTLNNVFCAPNKIFEYAACGIPMLTNDVPGLVGTVGRFGAGICLSTLSSERVADALLSLDNSYEDFAARAAQMFDAQQSRATIEQVCSLLLG
jgi:glycosyltransferase involved in cell wall biosynthesis